MLEIKVTKGFSSDEQEMENIVEAISMEVAAFDIIFDDTDGHEFLFSVEEDILTTEQALYFADLADGLMGDWCVLNKPVGKVAIRGL
jgi:hypothetical protein